MKGRVPRAWALPLLWPLLLLGSGLCLYLAWTHVSLTHGLGSFESFCLAGEIFDCDAVNTSPASELFGVPTSLYCLGLYAGMFLLVGPAHSESRQGERSRGALRLLATLNLLASLGLAWYSHAHLQAWCLFCLGLYAVNALAFLLVWILPGPPFSLPTGRGFLRALSAAVVAFLLSAMGAFGWGVHLNQQVFASDPPSGLQTESRPAGVVRLPEASAEKVTVEPFNAGLGPADAAVQVVVFSDFECEQCRKLRSTLGALQERYQDSVRFVFKHFPMEQDCNRFIDRSLHPRACEAAIAAQCAQRQEKFWSFHDILFKNQRKLEYTDLVHYAEEAGLDGEDFDACLRDPEVAEEIAADVEEGARIGVTEAPQITIAGREFRGAVSAPILDAAIRVALGVASVDERGRVEAHREVAVGEGPGLGPAEMTPLDGLGERFWIDVVESGLDEGGGARSVAGGSPAVVSWYEASAACEGAGKRLCSQEEWLLACAGVPAVDSDGNGHFYDDYVQGRSFPHGDDYLRGVCWDAGHRDRQGPETAGSRAGCASPEGVYDLSGNMQEWVGADQDHAVLMGGAWYHGEQAGCGNASSRFGPGFANRSTGFRCCADQPPKGPQGRGEHAREPGPVVGEPLPGFVGESFGGSPLGSELLRGKVGLVNFWASWCPPCQRELPLLARLQRELGPAGFQVLGINVDREGANGLALSRDLNLPFPVIVDSEAEILGRFDAMAMPYSLLVGTDGRVVLVHDGYDDAWASTLGGQIRRLLEE